MATGAVLLVVLAVLVAIVWPGEKEPEYQGKKLSYWLERSKQASNFRSSGKAQRPCARLGPMP
jgi:hypothetical protein